MSLSFKAAELCTNTNKYWTPSNNTINEWFDSVLQEFGWYLFQNELPSVTVQPNSPVSPTDVNMFFSNVSVFSGFLDLGSKYLPLKQVFEEFSKISKNDYPLKQLDNVAKVYAKIICIKLMKTSPQQRGAFLNFLDSRLQSPDFFKTKKSTDCIGKALILKRSFCAEDPNNNTKMTIVRWIDTKSKEKTYGVLENGNILKYYDASKGFAGVCEKLFVNEGKFSQFILQTKDSCTTLQFASISSSGQASVTKQKSYKVEPVSDDKVVQKLCEPF